MILSRYHEEFATRLTINQNSLERTHEMIYLGVWVTSDIPLEKNTAETCKRSYSRIKMVTKLKFVGVQTEELFELYCLHIHSLTDYCSPAIHSSLSQQLSNKIEWQNWVHSEFFFGAILGAMHVTYDLALEMRGIKTLYERRENRAPKFALTCTDHKDMKTRFSWTQPLTPLTLENGKFSRITKRIQNYTKVCKSLSQKKITSVLIVELTGPRVEKLINIWYIWYLYYYPHRSRDSLSPVCGIFLQFLRSNPIFLGV